MALGWAWALRENFSLSRSPVFSAFACHAESRNSADSAIRDRRRLQKLRPPDVFCRGCVLASVENAEGVRAARNHENSWFHPSGLLNCGSGINPPVHRFWWFVAGRTAGICVHRCRCLPWKAVRQRSPTQQTKRTREASNNVAVHRFDSADSATALLPAVKPGRL